MKRIIYVLKKDLADPNCSVGSTSDCPIARAVKRIVKRGVAVSVGISGGNIGPENVFFGMPDKYGNRVFNDNVKPFRFTIDLPPKYLKRRRKAA